MKLADLNLVEITESDYGLKIDLMYADENHPYNIAGQVYWPQAKCLLHKEAALCLKKAAQFAKERYGWTLVVHDAFRPLEAQQFLVDNYPNPEFIVQPEKSRHVRGAAVDVSVHDKDGHTVDMGTNVDAPTSDSGHNCWYLKNDPVLNKQIIGNRVRLAALMWDAGFEGISNEWWHYQLPQVDDWKIIYNKDLPTDYKMMP